MSAAPGGRTRPEDRDHAPIYWQKAMRYAHAARTNAEQEDWDPAVANAINAVINVIDALCVHYQGLRSSSGFHRDALQVLDGCRDLDAQIRATLRKHLTALLSEKGLAQYEARLLEEEHADVALGHLQRALRAAEPIATTNRWRVSRIQDRPG